MDAQTSDTPFRYRIKPDELAEIATHFGTRMRDLLVQHWKAAAYLLVNAPTGVDAETSDEEIPETAGDRLAGAIELVVGVIKGELAAWKGFCRALDVDPASFAQKTASDEADELAAMFPDPPIDMQAFDKCLEQLRTYWNQFAERSRSAP